MHRRTSLFGRLAGSLFVALAFLAADFSTAAPGEPVQAPGLARGRPGALGVVPEAGFFRAIDQGFFREQGIELDLTPFDSAARMVPALGTGQLDVGDGSHSAGLFNAVARGIGIKLVADAASGPVGHPTVALLFRQDLAE